MDDKALVNVTLSISFTKKQAEMLRWLYGVQQLEAWHIHEWIRNEIEQSLRELEDQYRNGYPS